MPPIPIPSFPLINGVKYDHSSVELFFDGVPYVGFKSAEYSHSLDPGELRGTAPGAYGRTRGKYSAEGSLEMYKLDWKGLCAALALKNLGFMEASFDILVTYSENLTLDVMKDRLIGCRIKKSAVSSSEGGDPTVQKLDLHIMHIVENGLPAYLPKIFNRLKGGST